MGKIARIVFRGEAYENVKKERANVLKNRRAAHKQKTRERASCYYNNNKPKQLPLLMCSASLPLCMAAERSLGRRAALSLVVRMIACRVEINLGSEDQPKLCP